VLTQNVPKVPHNFNCEKCDYNTSRKSQYDRHVLTAKHIQLTQVNDFVNIISSDFICNYCKKIYKSRVGLWEHKQKCIIINTEDSLEQSHKKDNYSEEIMTNYSLSSFDHLLYCFAKKFQKVF